MPLHRSQGDKYSKASFVKRDDEIKSAKIAQWTAADINAETKNLGLDGSPTRVVKIFTPPPRKGGEMIKGDTSEVSKKVAELLKDILI